MTESAQPRLCLRDQDLAGKVAVVTGASRGIGRSIALNLASRGCSILATCSSTQSLHHVNVISHSVADLYRSAPQTSTKPHIVAVAADICNSQCHVIIADAVQKHFGGKTDNLINNAAWSRAEPIDELNIEDIQKYNTANVQTPILIVQELVKRKYFQRESRIIYLSSIRTRQPWSMQLMYSATKSAGESLCRTWAQAFGGRDEQFAFMAGTTANSISVGLTATDSVLSCGTEAVEGFKAEFMSLQSIPRFGQPEDVADAICLFVSRDARWITGSVISVSGGGIKIQ